MTQAQPFAYLKSYSKFKSVEEMDKHVQQHLAQHSNEIKNASRQVLFAIARHALDFVGAAHLKAETIANEIGMSTKSVYRAAKELVECGIIAKENKVKLNGIKGANVYAILPYVSSDVPSSVSHRDEAEKPCESKVEEPKNENESLNLLITKKSLNNTNTTEVRDNATLLIEGLLSKVPTVLANVIRPFFSTSDDMHSLIGTIYRAKAKVDKSIKIEEHANLYRKVILSVFSTWKRGKADNVFAVMYKAIKDVTAAIVDGTAYQVKEQPIVERKITGRVEKLPDWFETRHEKIEKEVSAEEEAELEAHRQRVLAKLGLA